MINLKEKALNSLFWTFGDAVFVKLLPFVATLYIGRILTPADFGLIATVAIFFQISLLLIDSGISSSLIRTANPTQEDYSTLFFFNLAIGFSLFILLYFFSPMIALYFGQPKLVTVIKAYGAIMVIVSFSSVQNAMYCKELWFKKLAIISFIATLLSSILGIILSRRGFEYKSILYMQASNQLLFSILIWFNSSWRPKFIFSLEKLKYHLDFGYKLLLSGFLNVFYKEIYKVILAKNYSVVSVGLFDRARTLNDYPNTMFSSIFTKVMYPVFVKVIEENGVTGKSKNAFKQILQINYLLFIPMAFVLAAMSAPLVMLLLGSQWAEAIPYFKLLCIASAFYTTHNISVTIIKTYGRSDWFLKLEIIKKLAFTGVILFCLGYGIIGLLVSIVVSSVMELFINAYFVNKLIDYSYVQLVKDILPVLLFSISLYWILIFLYQAIACTNLCHVFISIACSAISFLLYNFLGKTVLYQKSKEFLAKQ